MYQVSLNGVSANVAGLAGHSLGGVSCGRRRAWGTSQRALACHLHHRCLSLLSGASDNSDLCSHVHVEQYRWAPALLRKFLKSHHKNVKFPSQDFSL